jgi:hypothetical protein
VENLNDIFAVSPNPFNPVVSVLLRITDKNGFAGKKWNRMLSVFDIRGVRVASLEPSRFRYNSANQISSTTWQWNAGQAASGAYVIRIDAGNGKVLTKKVVLTK